MKKNLVIVLASLFVGGVITAYACFAWAPNSCPCVKDWGKVCVPCDGGGQMCTWRTEGPKMDCAWDAPSPDYEKHNEYPRDCVYQKVWQECDGSITSTPMTNTVTPTYSTGWLPPCPGGG